jgi:hypothetical protein
MCSKFDRGYRWVKLAGNLMVYFCCPFWKLVQCMCPFWKLVQCVRQKENLENIPNKGRSPYPYMPKIQVTEQGVHILLKHIKPHKATGPDKIQGWFFVKMFYDAWLYNVFQNLTEDTGEWNWQVIWWCIFVALFENWYNVCDPANNLVCIRRINRTTFHMSVTWKFDKVIF